MRDEWLDLMTQLAQDATRRFLFSSSPREPRQHRKRMRGAAFVLDQTVRKQTLTVVEGSVRRRGSGFRRIDRAAMGTGKKLRVLWTIPIHAEGPRGSFGDTKWEWLQARW